MPPEAEWCRQPDADPENIDHSTVFLEIVASRVAAGASYSTQSGLRMSNVSCRHRSNGALTFAGDPWCTLDILTV